MHGLGDFGIPPFDPGRLGNPGDHPFHRRIQVGANRKTLLLLLSGIEDRRRIGRTVGPYCHNPFPRSKLLFAILDEFEITRRGRGIAFAKFVSCPIRPFSAKVPSSGN
ncbi:MAG: hypothetical protein ACREEM_48070 [Blastocatellia bacterium]